MIMSAAEGLILTEDELTESELSIWKRLPLDIDTVIYRGDKYTVKSVQPITLQKYSPNWSQNPYAVGFWVLSDDKEVSNASR